MKPLNLFLDCELPDPLKEEELRECFLKLKNNDQNAREKIIVHNIRLVINQVTSKFSNTRYDAKELTSIGMIGLIKAVDTFDINKNYKFSSYACVCIRNEILMYIRENNRRIDICSLNEKVPDTEKDLEAINAIEDENVRFVDDFINEEEKRVIKEVIDSLDEKSKKIIKLYFGFECEAIEQKKIAAIMHISQPHISRILKQSVLLIKQELENRSIIEHTNKEIRLRKVK